MKCWWIVAGLVASLLGCGRVGPALDSSEPNAERAPTLGGSVTENEAEGEPAAEPAVAVEICGKMTRKECMASTTCTLELAAGGKARSGQYVCRPAAGACEEDLAQAALSAGRTRAEADESVKLCTSRAGCVFRANDCYCDCNGYGRTEVEDGDDPAGACLCFCAGGSPDACVATE